MPRLERTSPVDLLMRFDADYFFRRGPLFNSDDVVVGPFGIVHVSKAERWLLSQLSHEKVISLRDLARLYEPEIVSQRETEDIVDNLRVVTWGLRKKLEKKDAPHIILSKNYAGYSYNGTIDLSHEEIGKLIACAKGQGNPSALVSSLCQYWRPITTERQPNVKIDF